MKKNTVYIIVLIIFTAAIAGIFYKYSSNTSSVSTQVYTLLARKGAGATAPEWQMVKQQSFKLLEAIKTNPADTKSLTQLASLYIQEARATGNYAYYDKAAMKYINDALEIDKDNPEATILKSLIYLSQHHFAEGLELAEQAKSLNPYNAFVYGVSVDGNTEMGNYEAAVADADKMLSIRPDLRSYSRASYLREIYGDHPGAIEAMKMAVEAGPPGDESAEWARTQLGHLYENAGDLLQAAMHYTISLDNRPGYAYALAGLARVATAQNEYNKALQYYQQADSSVSDLAIQEAVAELYRLMGKKAEANILQMKIIETMKGEAESGNEDESIGHYVHKELAYAYLNMNDYENALKHALLEYSRRPDNIDVNECVAWVYYSTGEYAKALPYIKAALRTNCKNPTLLCRAGLIYAKAGDKPMAKVTLQEALQANPNITGNLKTEGLQILNTL